MADGGFQVGELAKCYFPGGHDIKTLNYDEALSQTNDLLKKDQVIIYEAAIRFETLFIRVDILIKNKNHIELVEVKAKSVDTDSEDAFLNKSRSITASWKPYLEDVAFQKHVIRCAFPEYTVSAYLMMANKMHYVQRTGLIRNSKSPTIKTGEKVSRYLKLSRRKISPSKFWLRSRSMPVVT